MYRIVHGYKKSVSPEEAKELNFYLKRNPINFASILSSAIQEAEEKVKELPDLPPPSKGTKRPLSAATALDDPDASRSKKQRTAVDDQQWTTLDVNAFSFYNGTPSLSNQGSFQEISSGQVFNAQAALPEAINSPPETVAVSQEFDSPFDFNATGEMDRSENSLTEQPFPSQTFSDSFDFGFDAEPINSTPFLNWEDWDPSLNGNF